MWGRGGEGRGWAGGLSPEHRQKRYRRLDKRLWGKCWRFQNGRGAAVESGWNGPDLRPEMGEGVCPPPPPTLQAHPWRRGEGEGGRNLHETEGATLRPRRQHHVAHRDAVLLRPKRQAVGVGEDLRERVHLRHELLHVGHGAAGDALPRLGEAEEGKGRGGGVGGARPGGRGSGDSGRRGMPLALHLPLPLPGRGGG